MDDELINRDGVEGTPTNKKKYIIIFFISFILIVGLVIFLIIILRGKGENDEKEIVCKPGYFLPYDDLESKKCKKCSISNCKICKGTKSNDTCYTCDKNYLPIYENNIIETCDLDDEKCLNRDKETNKCLNCDSKYYLVNGICKSYSFMATYQMDNPNERIQLISGVYVPYIGGIYMNNSNIDIDYGYNFPIGNHTLYFNINISSLDSLTGMFAHVYNMISISFTPEFDTKNIKNMYSMFHECKYLTSINLSYLNTSSVTTMVNMFGFCYNLTALNLSNFDTSNVTDMTNMFGYCQSLTSIDVSNFDTSKVTNMEVMFQHCKSLASINLSSFNTPSLITMNFMFLNSTSLTSIDLSTFNRGQLSNIGGFFLSCNKLSYIDYSPFPESFFEKSVFLNVSNTGTIIINKNVSRSIVEELFGSLNMSWTILEK